MLAELAWVNSNVLPDADLHALEKQLWGSLGGQHPSSPAPGHADHEWKPDACPQVCLMPTTMLLCTLLVYTADVKRTPHDGLAQTAQLQTVVCLLTGTLWFAPLCFAVLFLCTETTRRPVLFGCRNHCRSLHVEKNVSWLQLYT